MQWGSLFYKEEIVSWKGKIVLSLGLMTAVSAPLFAQEGTQKGLFARQKLAMGSTKASSENKMQQDSPKMQECGVWLPSCSSIFSQYAADPHQVGFGIAMRVKDRILDTNIGYVSFGAVMPVYRCDLFWKGWDLEVGVVGNLWGTFDLEATSKDLINTDWIGGIPVAVRKGPVGIRARLYHISSHLGDEFLLRSTAPTRVNPSYEAIDLAVDYKLYDCTRVYGQMTRLINHDSSYAMQPLQFDIGAEYTAGSMALGAFSMTPFAATHLRFQEVHSMKADFSGVLGMHWKGKNTKKSAHVTTQLECYSGYSYEGQFGHEKTDYVAFAIRYGS